MTSESDLIKFAIRWGSTMSYSLPIYEIWLIDKIEPLKSAIDGSDLDTADLSKLEKIAFYYKLSRAVDALHENWTDIHEGCYNHAFIACRFEGLANACGKEARMFFTWVPESKGFYEDEEPDILTHSAI